MKRVVITGMGTVNPLGNNVQETWDKAIQGISGITKITKFDSSKLNVHIAGEVKNLDCLGNYNESLRKKAKSLDNFAHFAMVASKQALDQSGLDTASDPYGTAIVIGSGIGGLETQQNSSVNFHLRGMRGISPMFIPAAIGNIAAGIVSIELGIRGPNLSTQTACATSNHAFAIAYMMIQMGYCHSVLAGGAEGSVSMMSIAGFARMHALSTSYNDNPTLASRPYDLSRDGFVVAEGAGVLMLEELEHAKKRGAEIIAEIASVGMSGDAHDLVIPEPEGEGAYHAMQSAINQAGIDCSQIDYINTHGTSTPLGDVAESKAVYRLLKGNEDNVHVGSTKGMHGHLLGATAGVEAIICIEALQKGVIPPNINIDEFDPAVALKEETINKETIEKSVNVVLSNSFGFGGHNSTLILKKFSN